MKIDPKTGRIIGTPPPLESSKPDFSNTSETELMMRGYGLTTAELFYHMPDHHAVLNSFVWQEYDIAPDHPELFKFVEFWQEQIEAPLNSVRFSHRKMIGDGEWRNMTGEFGPKDLGVSSCRFGFH